MSELTPEAAVERARSASGAAGAARAWRVRRLDRGSADYYLVLVANGECGALLAVVDVRTGEVTHQASLAASDEAAIIDPDAALARAGRGPGARAELVWRPCRASRSPLYPLWEVCDRDTCLYVDQCGRVHDALGDAGPGG